MPDLQQREYAMVWRSPDPSLRVTYTAAGDIADEEIPANAIDTTIGELGGKGWELVTVISVAHPSIGLMTEYFFKRPHDPNRGLKE